MKKLLLSLVLAVGLVFVGAKTLEAQSSSGGGLEISPVRGELSLAPGESSELKVKVTNNVAGPLTTGVLINDFEALEDGSTQLLGNGIEGPNSVRDFLGEINTATLQPKESYEAIIPVNVPASAAPGVYYSVVRFTANPLGENGEAQTGVTLSASVGYIVLVEVTGNLTESMSITKVTPSKNGNLTNILSSSPDSFTVTVSNNGETILKPFGTLQIFDYRNREVASLPVNQDDIKANSLPKTKRGLIVKGEDLKLGIGRYKTVTTVAFGQSGETIDFTTVFWVLPPVQVALIAIVIAAILVALGVYINRARKAMARRR